MKGTVLQPRKASLVLLKLRKESMKLLLAKEKLVEKKDRESPGTSRYCQSLLLLAAYLQLLCSTGTKSRSSTQARLLATRIPFAKCCSRDTTSTKS